MASGRGLGLVRDKPSPIADAGVRAFLGDLFKEVPHLLYFPSDAEHAAALTRAVAAFVPDALLVTEEAVGYQLTPDVLKTIAV